MDRYEKLEKRRAGALREQKAGELRRQYIRDYKRGKPCKDCGGCFEAVQMDFDHRSQADKLSQINELAAKRKSWKAIHEEIAKCDLVCSNCHRLRTEKQRMAVGQAVFTMPRGKRPTTIEHLDVILA